MPEADFGCRRWPERRPGPSVDLARATALEKPITGKETPDPVVGLPGFEPGTSTSRTWQAQAENFLVGKCLARRLAVGVPDSCQQQGAARLGSPARPLRTPSGGRRGSERAHPTPPWHAVRLRCHPCHRHTRHRAACRSRRPHSRRHGLHRGPDDPGGSGWSPLSLSWSSSVVVFSSDAQRSSRDRAGP